MSVILRPEFPNPPSVGDISEGGASPGAPLAMSPPGEASIRLLCKTLERAALTKEQRFRRWLLDNPVMERNPYARQWFENAEARMYGYDCAKEYEAQGPKQYGEKR